MDTVADRPWTIERFLDWDGHLDGRWEFDGVRPVAMTGGNGLHMTIIQNLQAALRSRLRGTDWKYYGPELGIRTVGNRVRYPDTLVTGTRFALTEKLAPNPVVVFEVISPGSGHLDRIEKLGEYAAVTSIRHYAIIESRFAGVTVFSRGADEGWVALGLSREREVALPAVGITLPVAELYEDITFDSPLPSREGLGEGDVQS